MNIGHGAKVYLDGKLLGVFPGSNQPSPNCRCAWIPRQPTLQEQKAEELGRKLAAKILLAGHDRRLVLPSYDEWVGVHLLERDDEL